MEYIKRSLTNLPEMSLLLLPERMELQARTLVKDVVLMVMLPADRRVRAV